MAIALLLIILGVWLIAQALFGNLAGRIIGS